MKPRKLGLHRCSVNFYLIEKHFEGFVEVSGAWLEGGLVGPVVIRKLTKVKPYQMSPQGVYDKVPDAHRSMCGSPEYLSKELSLD